MAKPQILPPIPSADKYVWIFAILGIYASLEFYVDPSDHQHLANNITQAHSQSGAETRHAQSERIDRRPQI